MNEQGPSAKAAFIAFLGCLVLANWLLTGPTARAATFGILNPTPFDSADGQQIFERICRGCHMPDAGGAIGAGRYPALAKDPALVSRDFMALTILKGRRNMPAFGARYAIGFGGPPAVLSETQIAAVVNYVRSHFGNHYKDEITAAEVRALDQSAR